jgi:hypothetical protein
VAPPEHRPGHAADVGGGDPLDAAASLLQALLGAEELTRSEPPDGLSSAKVSDMRWRSWTRVSSSSESSEFHRSLTTRKISSTTRPSLAGVQAPSKVKSPASSKVSRLAWIE